VAYWEDVRVEPDFAAYRARDRVGGRYARYHPDRLMDLGGRTEIDAAAASTLVDATSAVYALGQRLRERHLPLLSYTLLRSESIASSWIEGLRETPRNVMAAGLEDVGTSSVSASVLRNMTAMTDAVEALRTGAWDHSAVHAVHHALLPRSAENCYRRDQVFIGGSSPLTAQFVPPPYGEVDGYMDDLLRYANESADPPVLKAAILHAQFETIHPYDDGNGRIGRALFHGVLARAGAVDSGVVPLSMALREDKDGYVAALTAFRHGSQSAQATVDANSRLVTFLMNAVLDAVGIAQDVIRDVEGVLERWAPHLARYRVDSSIHRIVALAIEQPVLTAGYVMERLRVTRPTAMTNIAELVRAGILQRAGGRFRRQEVFQATDVLRVMEDYLPGVQTVSLPALPSTPAGRSYGGPRCGRLLPRKGVPCTLPLGHAGSCRDTAG